MAVLPDPLAADAVVMIVSDTRTLAVRPGEASGYAPHLWRVGHRALVESEEVGGFAGPP
jgi:hypothetical protein